MLLFVEMLLDLLVDLEVVHGIVALDNLAAAWHELDHHPTGIDLCKLFNLFFSFLFANERTLLLVVELVEKRLHHNSGHLLKKHDLSDLIGQRC